MRGALSRCEGSFALLRVVAALPYTSGRFVSHSSFPSRVQFREVCIIIYYEIRIVRLQLERLCRTVRGFVAWCAVDNLGARPASRVWISSKRIHGARSEGFRQKRWVSQTVCFQVL
jgi:hypothetical protein